MSAARKDRAAPPAPPGQWEVRFGNTPSAKGWEVLCEQAPTNTYRAWLIMRSTPTDAADVRRHHRLRGKLAHGSFDGIPMDHWQIEVTGSGRIWYLVDEKRQTVWIDYASTGHPKATD